MITQFKDNYRWLSNFWFYDNPMLITTEFGILRALSNEHFYAAMKNEDPLHLKAALEHPSKGLKKFGTSVELREDWHEIKEDVMLHALRYKFSKDNPILRSKLLATGDQEIQEGNSWGDKYWGVCLKTGEGENRLGRLIMQVRSEIVEEEDI